MGIFDILFYEPIYNSLIVLYRLLGENLGLSIIAFAFIARLLMVPLTLKQIQMAESNKVFSEKVKEIKKKYKKNKEKQQEELMKIQAEFLPGQIAGCLPMIFQFIFFINIYRVIRNLIDEKGAGFNEVAYSFVEKLPSGYEPNADFFGVVDLTKSASSIGFSDTHIIPYIILILLVGLSQYGSMKILSAMRTTKKDEKEVKDKKGKKKDGPEDFAEILQQSTQQTMMLMPAVIMFVAFSLPAGLSLYWITQSGFVIIQQFVIQQLKKKFSSAESEQNI